MAPAARCPLVGVSTYRQVTTWWSWERDAALVPGTYLDLVESAGAQAVLVPPAADPVRTGRGAGLDRLVGVLDGLVLIGGGDLEAARYGQETDRRNAGTSAARDELELGLLAAALSADLPVLAICRGMQLLNVHLGGDLLQHLPDTFGTTAHQPEPGVFGEIAVTTAEGSTVRRVLGERVDVLCSHHQGVGALGRGLVVTARSEDGIVEAVELADHRFVVGVQWHPEESGDARLLEALVGAMREEPVGAAAPSPPGGSK